MGQVYNYSTNRQNQARFPQIFIKLNQDYQKEEILDISKNFKKYGLEGIVISSENSKKEEIYKLLRSVYMNSEGNLGTE